MKRLIITPNGREEVEMTAEEITAKEKLDAEIQAFNQAEQEAKTQKEANQASGNQKLLDLGLTQAEATALTGYTPPSEV